MTEKYIITTPGHLEVDGFEGTWTELVKFIDQYYQQEGTPDNPDKEYLCCVKDFYNSTIGYDWEDLHEKETA